jgi:hypothetical protein
LNMGWFSSRKSTPEAETDRGSTLGLDLNAGTVRAIAGRGGRHRVMVLDDPFAELPLAVSLRHRTPEVGRAGTKLIRRLPHAVCSNYLPFLGQPQEWNAGRNSLVADEAMLLVLRKIQEQCAGFEHLAVALPNYLVVSQVTRLVPLLQRVKLPLSGTVAAPLAIAADRAVQLLHDEPLTKDSKTWVVPMLRNGQPAPATVVIVDLDDYALSLSLIKVDNEQAQVLANSVYPRLGLRIWKDRLLDLVSDRCVRLCRRDPRDSAEAEQSLYEQLEASLDLIRDGHRVAVKARAAHWFQDMILQPDDFENFCAPLLKQTLQAVNDLVTSAAIQFPPRAIWLLNEAGRLPGLRKMLHQHATERTFVSLLPTEAVAMAAANLAERWRLGELPRVHLDGQIALPKKASEAKPVANKTAPTKRV